MSPRVRNSGHRNASAKINEYNKTGGEFHLHEVSRMRLQQIFHDIKHLLHYFNYLSLTLLHIDVRTSVPTHVPDCCPTQWKSGV